MNKQTKTNEVARKLLNSGKTVEEIVKIVQNQSKSAQMQLRILDGFNNTAQAQGRYPSGTPSLGDEIINELAFNIRRNGSSTYKLSDKQVTVIIRDVYGYRNSN